VRNKRGEELSWREKAKLNNTRKQFALGNPNSEADSDRYKVLAILIITL